MPPFNIRTTADEVIAAFASRVAHKNGTPFISQHAEKSSSDVVLITGTTLGSIGFEMARAIAGRKDAGTLIVANRNEEKWVSSVSHLFRIGD